jgi:hypothetical protein
MREDGRYSNGPYNCDLGMWTAFRWFEATVNAVIHLWPNHKKERV